MSTNALGPVLRNRLEDMHKVLPKPHLQNRLAADTVRFTQGGLMLRDGDARLSFIPGHLPMEPVPAPQLAVPQSCPAEGADETAFMAGDSVAADRAAAAFDPYTEPLALGDTVQGTDGQIGRVTLAQPRRLGVVFEHGSAWTGDVAWRSPFRLLAKAGAWGYPNDCPF